MKLKRPKLLLIIILMVSSLIFSLHLNISPGTVKVEETIKIGMLGPLAITTGKDMKLGAELAIKEINSGGGVAVDGTMHELELVVRTTSHPTTGLPDVDTGVNNLQALQDQDEVVASLGLFRREVTIACMGKMDRPFIGVGSSAPIITPYFWRLFPSNGSQLTSALLSLYALGLSDVGVQNITIVREDAAWSLAMSNSIKFYLNSYLPTYVGTPIMNFTDDIKLMGDTSYSSVESALTPIKSELDGLTVNAIMTIFAGSAGRHITKAWSALNMTQFLAGINREAQSSTHFEKTEGAAYGELYLIALPPDINVTSKSGLFRQAFFNEYGELPTPTATAAYDAVYVIADAIERTNSFNSTDIQTALADTEYLGASYKIKFTSEPNVWTHPIFGYPYGHVAYYDNGTRYVIPGVPTDLIVHDLYTTSGFGQYGQPYIQVYFVQWQKGGERRTVWGKGPSPLEEDLENNIEWPINHNDHGYISPEPAPTSKPETKSESSTRTTEGEKTSITSTSEEETSKSQPSITGPGFNQWIVLLIIGTLAVLIKRQRKINR
ncbi:MAG: ABC transporter substrate-binding protein [Candidatus Heimdallarchaeota archaeon]|nr:MAG: ABC transporter substrate-binding protein [Candidatus Heimdallarchaeota archaeon]